MTNLMTVDDAARDIFHAHPVTVRGWVRRGVIPHIKVGGAIRIPEDDLRNWIATNVRGGTPAISSTGEQLG